VTLTADYVVSFPQCRLQHHAANKVPVECESSEWLRLTQ